MICQAPYGRREGGRRGVSGALLAVTTPNLPASFASAGKTRNIQLHAAAEGEVEAKGGIPGALLAVLRLDHPAAVASAGDKRTLQLGLA